METTIFTYKTFDHLIVCFKATIIPAFTLYLTERIYSSYRKITRILRRLEYRYSSVQVHNGINMAPIADRLFKLKKSLQH